MLGNAFCLFDGGSGKSRDLRRTLPCAHTPGRYFYPSFHLEI